MRNRLLARLRRLREPKYLIGTFFGVAYFGFIFFGRGGGRGGPGVMWAIGDERGLAELAVLGNLAALNLIGTGVTDEGLEELARLKNLTELRIGAKAA